jgi:beta-glucanase (GH16 family)
LVDIPRLAERRAAVLALALLAAIGCAEHAGPSTSDPWVEVWREEFDGPAGAGVDPARWRHDTADGCASGICGWGNNEKEYYSTSPDNVALNGQGQLAIVARPAPPGLTCYYGPCRYTSGKITTRGKMNAEPGRVEARIRLPAGQGLWPAFWMLGSGHPQTPWPLCGELDIMENHGSAPASVSSAVHGPGYSGNTPFAKAHALQGGTFADGFQLFAIEWDSLGARFFVDSIAYHSVTSQELQKFGDSILGRPYYLVINLAVGGNFDGDPASDAILPATLLVDYVRAYRRRSFTQ